MKYNGVLKWCEISDGGFNQARLELVSKALRARGVENELSFVEMKTATIESELLGVLEKFHEVRIGGMLRDFIPKLILQDVFPHMVMPATLLSLLSADALSQIAGRWGPRNFLVEGLQRSIASDLDHLDLSSGVFLIGATPESRAAVASFARIGFQRFTMIDSDEELSQAFVDELRSLYFNVQFQSVNRRSVTQLPGVHSVAVNSLKLAEQAEFDGEADLITELSYFNFLRAGGAWMDLRPEPQHRVLELEAASIGAVCHLTTHVFSASEAAWMHEAVGVHPENLDEPSLRAEFETLLTRPS